MNQSKLRIFALASLIAVPGLPIAARCDTTITTFDTPGFSPVNALYASWQTATINATPTNYVVVNAFTYGSLWKQLGAPPINAAGNTNIVLDVTLEAANPAAAASNLTVIVDLKDGQSPETSFGYRFKGLSPGRHLLVGNLFSTNPPATDNGVVIPANLYEIHTNSVNSSTRTLDLSQLWHLNLELDPTGYTNAGNTYTVAWNDLTLTGSASGEPAVTNLCATIDGFNNTTLAGLSGNWTNQVPTQTSLLITAAGYGDGYAAVTPALSSDPAKTLQVNLTLTAPGTANGKLGPLVVLQDGSGNQIRYAWYGQSPATNLVLTSALGAGTIVVGTNFDFSTISFFHVQLDPSSYTGAYTVAWNDLSLTGCTNVVEGGVCATLQTFDGSGITGVYGSWTSDNLVLTPTNVQFTATGYGGGYRGLFPAVSSDATKTLRLDVNLEAPASAIGKLGPIVVLEDGDGTQMQYAWYGQSPGDNLVLTRQLGAGTPVAAQPGAIPGFDFTTISWFHVQLDPSSFTGTYTVGWNNLDIVGCAPPPGMSITSWSYDRVSQLFTLSWNSVDGATYAVQAATTVNATFSDIITGIPSAGSTTSVSVSLSDPISSFVRVRRE